MMFTPCLCQVKGKTMEEWVIGIDLGATKIARVA